MKLEPPKEEVDQVGGRFCRGITLSFYYIHANAGLPSSRLAVQDNRIKRKSTLSLRKGKKGEGFPKSPFLESSLHLRKEICRG